MKFNIATIAALAAGLVLLAASALLASPSVMGFINLAGLGVVVGGTLAASAVGFSPLRIIQALKVFALSCKPGEANIDDYVEGLAAVADQYSSSGAESLARPPGLGPDPFFDQGLAMAAAGVEAGHIEKLLDQVMRSEYESWTAKADVFRAMARFSPAFGLAGGLIGMIGMTRSMGADPAGAGPAMGAALTAILYGLLLAYLVFIPMAVRIERRAGERYGLMSLVRQGLVLAASGVSGDGLRAGLGARSAESGIEIE